MPLTAGKERSRKMTFKIIKGGGNAVILQALAVGCGGFCGAVLRWLLTLIPHAFAFPLPVLLINAGGSFAIGLLYGVSLSRAAVNHHMMLLLQTGFCGGFTTFSTFSLDNLKLIENGRYMAAALNAALSVIICLAAVWLGKAAGVAAMR